MIPYPHFAVSNLFLQNGYEEFQLPGGVAYRYTAEDDLEQCIRRVLLRKPKRLRGWDIRFLRRGLALSQAELGKMFERDAQTIARWEKSKRKVPKLADFAIRSRFAEKFEPGMTVKELSSYIDGSAPMLPSFIALSCDGAHWMFSFRPMFPYLQSDASSREDISYARGPGAIFVVYETSRKQTEIREELLKPEWKRHKLIWRMYADDFDALSTRSNVPAVPLIEFKDTESDNGRQNETRQ